MVEAAVASPVEAVPVVVPRRHGHRGGAGVAGEVVAGREPGHVPHLSQDQAGVDLSHPIDPGESGGRIFDRGVHLQGDVVDTAVEPFDVVDVIESRAPTSALWSTAMSSIE